MTFTQYLINWYQIHQRDLPWRRTQDPYKIWLSEIILQQTKVIQGLPYFQAFIAEFPSVSELAIAEEDIILKLWQGLGYYSRARNLHQTAKVIESKYQGVFPDTYSELIKLKGVGPYTAAAIASFAFGEKKAVVDGNVFRVLSRYFGVFEDISIPKTRNLFQELADDLIRDVNPAVFNHAIMDFGATQCTPKKTQCNSCLMIESCFAFRNNKVSELPIKTKKTKIKDRYFSYFIIKDQLDNVIIEQRNEKDIWQGLYQFPMIEEKSSQPVHNVKKHVMKYISDENCQIKLLNNTPIRHKLSHQLLHLSFYECNVISLKEKSVQWSDALDLPFPIVIWNFLQSYYGK